MEHLNDDLMSALSRGEARAVSYFRAHLSSPCDVCEAYLAGSEHPSLDALADLLLLQRTFDASDAKGFDRLRRRLSSSRRRAALSGVFALAVAAALALVLVPTTRPDDGIKGAGSLTVEVTAALSAPDGAVVRVDPSSTLPPRGILVLRYHASEAAKARVYRQRIADGSNTLLGEVNLEAGSHELPTGISLEGEAGRTTFRLEARSERGSANVDLTFDIQEE